MRVRYTATALAEIAEIVFYVAQDNQKAAAEISRAIERTVLMDAKSRREHRRAQ